MNTVRSTLNPMNRLYIYGRQPVLEALRSRHTIEKIWMAKDLNGWNVGQIKKMAQQKNTPITFLPKNDIQKQVGAVVHQGVAALVDFTPFISEADLVKLLAAKSNPLVVILDQIQDAHNIGAILRTAEITGVDVVAFPEKGSAPINATTAKTSAGALFNVALFPLQDYQTFFERLRQAAVKIYAALPSAKISLYQTDWSGGAAIIIGNEGEGVRKNLLPYCDQTISIPQYGRVNSLNASVSLAVILYEIIRQRNFAT